jgi:outer membrane protein OmpA-like peptidoglycan-associated protein
MSARAWSLTAALAAAVLAVSGCGGPELKLEMTREVKLIEPAIESVSLSPSGTIMTGQEPQIVKVTLRSDPDLQATFDLEGGATGQQMREVEPGVYVGAFQVRRGAGGTVSVVGRVLHAPSGAQGSRRAQPLRLDNTVPVEHCDTAMAEEFEKELEALTVRFEFNHFDIPERYKSLLSSNQKVLASHPLCPIRVHGHADETGSPEYNMNLSIKRAVEVQRYLESGLGIPDDRIEIYFHGETRPLDTSGTPEAQALNRRVEFHALYFE